MHKPLNVFGAMILGGVLGCAGQGPTKAVNDITEAAAQHDIPKFEQLVDVSSVSEKWGKDMVAALAASGVDLSVWERAGVSREYQERTLADQGATIIRECVSDGKCGDEGNPWTLARAFGALAGNQGKVESVAIESRDGKLATVALKIKPSDGAAEFLECKMRERDGQWRLVELLNQTKLERTWTETHKTGGR